MIIQEKLKTMSIDDKLKTCKTMAETLVARGNLQEDIKSLASGYYQRRFKKIAMGEAGLQAMVEFDMEKEEQKLDDLIIMYKDLNE